MFATTKSIQTPCVCVHQAVAVSRRADTQRRSSTCETPGNTDFASETCRINHWQHWHDKIYLQLLPSSGATKSASEKLLCFQERCQQRNLATWAGRMNSRMSSWATKTICPSIGLVMSMRLPDSMLTKIVQGALLKDTFGQRASMIIRSRCFPSCSEEEPNSDLRAGELADTRRLHASESCSKTGSM